MATTDGARDGADLLAPNAADNCLRLVDALAFLAVGVGPGTGECRS